MFAEWKSAGTNPGPKSIFRNPLLYTSTLLVIGVLYVAGVFIVRWMENRDIDRNAAEKQAQEKAADARQTFESLGGSRFEILGFYATPVQIHAGQETQLCYGVSNAKEVRIDPPSGNIWPAASRCVSVSPKKDTTYRFTAVDAQGNTKNATVTVQVR